MLSPKPWQPDRVMWLLAAFLGCNALGSLVVQGYQSALAKEGSSEATNVLILIAGTLMYQGVTLALVGVFLRVHQVTWREGFGFSAPRRVRAIVLAVLTFIIILPIAMGLGELSKMALEKLGQNPQAQSTVQTLQKGVPFAQQVYFGIIAIILAPIVEEIIFRGILYPSIKQFGYRKSALWITSLLFAVSHMNAVTFVPLTFIALVLTLLYETTDNLLAPMISHALFNAANFALILYGPPGAVSP